MEPDFRGSASKLKKFKGCPKQYEFRYISDREQTKADEGYLGLGSAVHECIENVLSDGLSEYRKDGSFPNYFGSESDLTYYIKRPYSSKVKKYDVPDDMAEDGEKYLANAAGFLASKDLTKIRDIEEWMDYNIKGQDMIAIMDVTTEESIWDWKTGKKREEDEIIQGAVYMGAYQSTYGHPPSAVNFIYLKDRKVRKVAPTDDNWQKMIQILEELQLAYEQENFPATPGDPCYFCGFEGYCSASPVGLGDVDWTQI